MPLRPPNEDLFEHTRMTFGEHLEELRKVLFRALIGVTIGVLVGMLFATNVVNWIKTPLTRAITEFMVSQAEGRLKENSGGVVPLEFRTLLGQRLMAPRRVQFDLDQLTHALTNQLPTKTTAPTAPATRFSVRNISSEQAKAISRRLVTSADGGAKANSSTGDSQAAIWRALSSDDQASVRAWASALQLAKVDIEDFVSVLNRLASQTELYADSAFAKLLSGTAQDNLFSAAEATGLKELNEGIADADSPSALQLKCQLNQWLIWSALTPDLTRPDVPFVEIDIWESVEVTAQSLSATEPFMIWMKAGLIVGIVIASPWIFYQIWLFVAAGLYPHEKRYVFYYLPISLGLFLGGAALAFFFVFDPVLKFLLQFNASMGIDPQPRLGEWLSFLLLLPLGFGIAFQLPMVMLFLNMLGIFTIANYLEKWRIAVLVIFIVSMVLTPAEPISMILMAVPLTLLYFLGIAMCRWLRPNRNPYRRAYEP